MAREEPGICFFLAPIGEEGTETRLRSDQVLNHVIRPVAEVCGYRALRADEISEPGIITTQVIQHVMDDPMVVADLTGWNPNVFYELALRHTLKKPAVHIIQAGEKIPFDVAGTRTVHLDYRDLDSVASCKAEIEKQIKAVEKDATLVDNPISASVQLQSLRQSDNPLEKSTAEMISMLQEIPSALDRMTVSAGQRYPAELFDEVVSARDTLRMLNKTIRELFDGLPPEHEVGVQAVEDALQRLNIVLARATSTKRYRAFRVRERVSFGGSDLPEEERNKRGEYYAPGHDISD